jgi:hypothetical protein
MSPSLSRCLSRIPAESVHQKFFIRRSQTYANYLNTGIPSALTHNQFPSERTHTFRADSLHIELLSFRALGPEWKLAESDDSDGTSQPISSRPSQFPPVPSRPSQFPPVPAIFLPSPLPSHPVTAIFLPSRPVPSRPSHSPLVTSQVSYSCPSLSLLPRLPVPASPLPGSSETPDEKQW